MSELIKRVAEAIKECDADHCADMSQFWIVHARAAIEAMREPTKEMTRSAWDNSPIAADDDEYAKVWQAMIDAALKVTEPAE